MGNPFLCKPCIHHYKSPSAMIFFLGRLYLMSGTKKKLRECDSVCLSGIISMARSKQPTRCLHFLDAPLFGYLLPRFEYSIPTVAKKVQLSSILLVLFLFRDPNNGTSFPRRRAANARLLGGHAHANDKCKLVVVLRLHMKPTCGLPALLHLLQLHVVRVSFLKFIGSYAQKENSAC
jgi:hypothetical protein